MELGILIVAFYIYAAICVVFYIHEMGHFPKKIHFKLKFPFPEAWSQSVPDWAQYTGLAANLLIFTAVWYYNPDNLFLKVVGLVAWVHFVWYLIYGSFNLELEKYLPPRLWGAVWFDDVNNDHWWIAVPVAIAAFFYFKSYYVPVIQSLIALI